MPDLNFQPSPGEMIQTSHDGKQIQSISVHGSGMLHGLARDAYKRAGSSESSRSNDAIAAVMLAAASAEAYVNEFADKAAAYARSTEDDKIVLLSEMLAELESSRTSIKRRLSVSRLILTGSGYKNGENPMQDFALLMELRNAIAHMHPTLLGGEHASRHARIIKALADRKLCAPDQPFITCISSPLIAKFACNAASAIIKDHARLHSFPTGSKVSQILCVAELAPQSSDEYDARYPEV